MHSFFSIILCVYNDNALRFNSINDKILIRIIISNSIIAQLWWADRLYNQFIFHFHKMCRFVCADNVNVWVRIYLFNKRHIQPIQSMLRYISISLNRRARRNKQFKNCTREFPFNYKIEMPLMDCNMEWVETKRSKHFVAVQAAQREASTVKMRSKLALLHPQTNLNGKMAGRKTTIKYYTMHSITVENFNWNL